jgi:hypothetical protein
VPWCEQCNAFHEPERLADGGACPGCGTVIAEPIKVPWHFKLLVVATVIYLGWRFAQGIGWVIHHL